MVGQQSATAQGTSPTTRTRNQCPSSSTQALHSSLCLTEIRIRNLGHTHSTFQACKTRHHQNKCNASCPSPNYIGLGRIEQRIFLPISFSGIGITVSTAVTCPTKNSLLDMGLMVAPPCPTATASAHLPSPSQPQNIGRQAGRWQGKLPKLGRRAGKGWKARSHTHTHCGFGKVVGATRGHMGATGIGWHKEGSQYTINQRHTQIPKRRLPLLFSHCLPATHVNSLLPPITHEEGHCQATQG